MNNSVKFYSKPIWYDGVSGFFEEVTQQEQQHNKMSSNMRSVPDKKYLFF